MRRRLRTLSRCRGGDRRWRWRRPCADRQSLRPCRLQHPAPRRGGRRTQRCALPGHWQARPAGYGRRAHACRRALTVHKEAHQQRPGGARSRWRPRAALRQARWQRAHLRLPAGDAHRQRVLSVPHVLQCRRTAIHPLNDTATVSGHVTLLCCGLGQRKQHGTFSGVAACTGAGGCVSALCLAAASLLCSSSQLLGRGGSGGGGGGSGRSAAA